MKSKSTTLVGVITLLFIAVVAFTCQQKSDSPPDHSLDSTQGSCSITPQEFPGKDTSGIDFPTDSNTIYGWINDRDTANMAKHSWGIWAGLTAPTNESCGRDNLRIFETWLGTQELESMMKQGIKNCTGLKKGYRTLLNPPSQFEHGAEFVGDSANLDDQAVENRPWVTVSYSPAASCYALTHDIFNQDVLEKMPGSIPPFPQNAITLKPTYLIVSKTADSLITFPVWPGQPSPAGRIVNFEKYWQYIFIDPTNQSGLQHPIPVPSDTGLSQDQIAGATTNLNNFIYFHVDSTMAAYLNSQHAGNVAKTGDIAILAAMHVATKEISNWVWHSFFWAPDPDNPPFPSSSFIASHRPKNFLTPAASHYAAVTVYNMVWPNQPISGGTNKGVKSHIGYNPYLEPHLHKLDGVPNEYNPDFKWGVQSNCMSCHALANNNSFDYTADQYIDMNSPYFNGKVKTDFSWSIFENLFAPTEDSK